MQGLKIREKVTSRYWWYFVLARVAVLSKVYSTVAYRVIYSMVGQCKWSIMISDVHYNDS